MNKVNKNDALEKHRRKLRLILVLIHALVALISYIMFAFGLVETNAELLLCLVSSGTEKSQMC